MEDLNIVSSFGFPKLLVEKQHSVYEHIMKELNSNEINLVKLHRVVNTKQELMLDKILNDNNSQHK